MQTPGGFAWWYVDLVDDEGRGLVLIWSFGLPFLPGSRQRPLPADRPALSVALYEDHEPVCYVLQTYDASEATVAEGVVRLGRSRFAIVESGDAVSLRADLDVDMPAGGRLAGSVVAQGKRCQAPRATSTNDGTHAWAPILVAEQGRARLALDDGTSFAVDGRIYLDSNGSTEPLHELGIEDWRWGRIAVAGRELIYYFVDPSDDEADPIRHVVEIDASGAMRFHDARVRWRQPRRGLYGLRYHEQLDLECADGLQATIHFRALVDDGPFYLRFLVDAYVRDGSNAAEVGHGVAERVVPAKVDQPWQRPFVRMRTHATAGPNSMWLPLFNGPRRGRLRRLLSHWLPGGNAQEVAS